MKKIAAMGEILWDQFPDGRVLGGAPTNFAILSKYLGNEASIISAVGNDDLGKEIFRQLEKWGVNTELLQISKDYNTGEVRITFDEYGIPKYQILNIRACDHMKYNKSLEAYLQEFDAIGFGAFSDQSIESMNTIFRFLKNVPEKCLKVCDFNMRKNYISKEFIQSLLELSDVFKINENERKILENVLGNTVDSLKNIRDLMSHYGIEVFIITNGEVRSEIITMQEYSCIPSKQVEVIDTVGAGDSFLAAFTDGYLHNQSIYEIHQNAVALSAEVCTCKGATGILEK